MKRYIFSYISAVNRKVKKICYLIHRFYNSFLRGKKCQLVSMNQWSCKMKISQADIIKSQYHSDDIERFITEKSWILWQSEVDIEHVLGGNRNIERCHNIKYERLVFESVISFFGKKWTIFRVFEKWRLTETFSRFLLKRDKLHRCLVEKWMS